MSQNALATMESPDKYAPGNGGESKVLGDGGESKAIEDLQLTETQPAAVGASTLEVESMIDVHEA